MWSYGYLLRRLKEVAEEYGIEVKYVDENSTSRTCPTCRVAENHRRITRGPFKRYRHNVVFNADLAGPFNILAKRKPITPSPALCGIGVTRLRPGAGLNRARARDIAPNHSIPREPSPLRGGEEVRLDFRQNYFKSL